MNKHRLIKDPLSLRLYAPVKSTGFKFHEIREGYNYLNEHKDYNHLFFLVEGKMRISCNEFINKLIQEGQFIMIPIASDVKCKALTSCKFMTFTFDDLINLYDRKYVYDLYSICNQSDYNFTLLSINEPLANFIAHFHVYIDQPLNKTLLHEIKRMELSVLLQSFYKKEQIAAMFHPLVGMTTYFRIRVLRNYRQINHVDELASVLGLEKRTFGRQFKDEFGVSPYQWLLNQKAKHVQFSLAESKQSLDTIRKEHGFKFAGHFTRFCKEQFDCTPMKLRRRLAYNT